MARRTLSRRCTDPALRPFARGDADRRVAQQADRGRRGYARHVPSIVNRTTLIKWATRARPAMVLERLPLWAADPAVRFLFTIDRDDEACNNPEFFSALALISGPGRIKVRVGNCRGKVEAINDGLAEEDWGHLCVVAADDFVPTSPRYARLLASLFWDRFPEGDGLLHTNDGRNGRRLNTLPVFDRRYFDRFGYCYNPQYSSLWCDNEQQEVAESLGRSCYVDDVIIRHDWIGDGGGDDLHRRNESYYERDARVYQARKKAGFPRDPVPVPDC